MRVVIQRVAGASVSIENKRFSEIGTGLLVLLGIEVEDRPADAEWLVNKILQLRIFDDKEGVMNRSILDAGGEMMVISQFTLHARTKKGNRPSYVKSAPPDVAIPLYKHFLSLAEEGLGRKIASGRFGAKMQVELVNDGPVTILIDSKQRE